VRKDGNPGVAVGMMGNGRAIYEDNVAVVDTQVGVQDAADDPVTGAQPFDPYRLLQSWIIVVCSTFSERPLGELYLALGITAYE